MSLVDVSGNKLAGFDQLRNGVPRLLFKYKGLNKPEDLARAIDILENNRIYLPTPSKLNDPFEGCSVVVDGHWAGCSMAPSLGYLQAPMQEALERFRVLSLTEKWDSPQMWAHYACGYEGLCIPVRTSSFRENCFKVEYGAEPERLSVPGPEILEGEGYLGSMDAYAGLSLLRKQIDWGYEAEWRVLFHESGGFDKFLDLPDDAIPFVLVGQKADTENVKRICEVCEKKNIPVFKTHQAPHELRIMALPMGLELHVDGRTAFEQSEAYCREHGIASFEELCGV